MPVASAPKVPNIVRLNGLDLQKDTQEIIKTQIDFSADPDYGAFRTKL
jgi:hypothetical protein